MSEFFTKEAPEVSIEGAMFHVLVRSGKDEFTFTMPIHAARAAANKSAELLNKFAAEQGLRAPVPLCEACAHHRH